MTLLRGRGGEIRASFDRRTRRPGLRSDRQRDAAFAPAPFGNARRHVVAPRHADAFCSVIDLRLERADIGLDLGIDAGEFVALDRLHRFASTVPQRRSEEHTSELQSLMRNSYAVFC